MDPVDTLTEVSNKTLVNSDELQTVVTSKKQIYRAQVKDKTGRWYFVHSRKIVPGQVLKDGSTNDKFDTSIYEISSKPPNRNLGRKTIDTKILLEGIPSIVKKVTTDEILIAASNSCWKLSERAQRIFLELALSSGLDTIKSTLDDYKQQHTDCNYLDYNQKLNKFVASWKSIKENVSAAPALDTAPENSTIDSQKQ